MENNDKYKVTQIHFGESFPGWVEVRNAQDEILFRAKDVKVAMHLARCANAESKIMTALESCLMFLEEAKKGGVKVDTHAAMLKEALDALKNVQPVQIVEQKTQGADHES